MARSFRTVSVIIPTYNRAHQLHRAIDSVLAQTYQTQEIIVVDDGSTDDTASVVARYDHKVRYVRQANAGVSTARNHGASLGGSDLLAFLDSDDVWKPEKLAVQIAALNVAPAAGWCISGCNPVGGDEEIKPGQDGWTAVFPVFREVNMTAETFFTTHFSRLSANVSGIGHAMFEGDAWAPLFLGNFVLPSSAVVDRNLFMRLSGFDTGIKLGEESEFFHRLAAAARVVIVPEPLVDYQMPESGSLTSSINTVQLVDNALDSLEKARALRDADGLSELYYRRGRQALLRTRAYASLSMKNGRGARRTIREAWSAGAPKDGWSLAIYGLSLVPAPALGALHQLKRLVWETVRASRTTRRTLSA